MSVRKRKWVTSTGLEKEAWVVDYSDAQGKRRMRTFAKKKDADAFAAVASVEIRRGTHIADSASITVSDAGENWIASAESDGLERASIDQYRQHLNLHIQPFIGARRLSQLTIPLMREFEDQLRARGRSPAMVRKVLRSLGSLIADAQERGLAGHNPVREMRLRRRKGKDRRAEGRQKQKLQVGKDIPTRDEIRTLVNGVEGRWRPLLITAIFTGLRASELRGLRWEDVNFERRAVQVRQRADRYNQIGRPKSAAGNRSVPVPPIVLNALREWKLRCPKSDLDLVFPNGNGKVESLANVINRGLIPAQIASGIVSGDGNAKYTGMHALRHFYASWCINRKEDGGLALPPKVVQERLGHSSITMTMDVYGHLFPLGDDTKELADAERALLA